MADLWFLNCEMKLNSSNSLSFLNITWISELERKFHNQSKNIVVKKYYKFLFLCFYIHAIWKGYNSKNIIKKNLKTF